MVASQSEEMNIAATNLFIANADQQEIWRAQARFRNWNFKKYIICTSQWFEVLF